MPLPSDNKKKNSLKLPAFDVIVLDVLLKGRKASRLIKMVLDTGASLTTLPSESAVSIGCDPSRPLRRIEMITASGVEYVSVVGIPQIQFMGFTLRNLEAACLNLPPKSTVSGLLGMNALRRFDILLAFSKKILELSQYK